MQPGIFFQLRFMELVETRLPAHRALPATLAELLNLRINSAYRRIRAEQLLSGQEYELLSKHFDITDADLHEMDRSDTVFYGC